VIVPNSKISSDQIINYTFLDPRYRIEMEVEIGYGQDVETVRQLIIDSVKDVEGVLLDKPVEVLYIEMGDGMIFRVRWWIESYIDTRRIYDRVNTALQYTFDQEGIELANLEYDINIRGGDRSADN
jgi:small-conductance mechanosensitive channel